MSGFKSLDEHVNKIHCMDCIDGLKAIPDESISLVFCSPPYNTDIQYASHEDNMTWIDYLNWLKQVWTECARVLRPGGRLAINIDAITNWDDDGGAEYTRPVYAELVNMMREIDGMNFRTEIMWCKHQVVGRATAWGSYMSSSNPVVRRNHEYVLVWSKGQWNLPGDSEYSDMTAQEFNDWTMSTWEISPEGRKLGKHPAPFPQELCRRVIKLFSFRGDIVLDPFCGSGTTCKVAVDQWRRFIGYDKDTGYASYAKSRVEKAISEQPHYKEAGGIPGKLGDYNSKVGYTTRSKRIEHKEPSRTQRKKKKIEPDIAEIY